MNRVPKICWILINHWLSFLLLKISIFVLKDNGWCHRSDCGTNPWTSTIGSFLVSTSQWCGTRIHCMWSQRFSPSVNSWQVRIRKLYIIIFVWRIINTNDTLIWLMNEYKINFMEFCKKMGFLYSYIQKDSFMKFESNSILSYLRR